MLLQIRVIAGFVFAVALPGYAQISAGDSEAAKWHQPAEGLRTSVLRFTPLRDASGKEYATAHTDLGPEEGAGKGSISVQELSQPLTGKSRKMIVEAERLLRRGENDKAVQGLEAAVKDRVAAPYAYSMLGAEYLRRGETDHAHEELEVAVALLPSHPPNHYHLALALARLHRDEEALTEARRALQLDPAQAEYRYILGVLLLKTGRKEEADFHLRMAAAEIPDARRFLVQKTGQ